MTMIEKVARAICAKHYARRFSCRVDDPLVTGNLHNWYVFKDDARTAIEAMREPSDAMAEAGADVVVREYAESNWESAKDLAENLNQNQVYVAMIDAALNEGKE